jgi:hypothetical protein
MAFSLKTDRPLLERAIEFHVDMFFVEVARKASVDEPKERSRDFFEKTFRQLASGMARDVTACANWLLTQPGATSTALVRELTAEMRGDDLDRVTAASWVVKQIERNFARGLYHQAARVA